jgi:hypothetical protein
MNLYENKTINSHEISVALSTTNDNIVRGIRRVLGDKSPSLVPTKGKSWRTISVMILDRETCDRVMLHYTTQQKLKVINLWWDKLGENNGTN